MVQDKADCKNNLCKLYLVPLRFLRNKEDFSNLKYFVSFENQYFFAKKVYSKNSIINLKNQFKVNK